MDSSSKKYTSVDDYIASFPPSVQEKLEEIRQIIVAAVPDAQEVISYNMPAVRQNGVLVYYAANKEHIGFYPTAAPVKVFGQELAGYKTSKGAIQFPMDKAIPKTLVRKITKFRAAEDREKAKKKAVKKK